MDCGVGTGGFSTNQNMAFCYKLNDLCTVFQAEVFGILMAADKMKDISGKDISFFIDSQATIRAVGSYNIRSKLVKSCREFLKKLASQNKLRLCWVPGHEGHEGNERADELAREGSESQLDVQQEVFPSISAKKKQISTSVQQVVLNRWDESTTCRTTKILWPSLNKGKSKAILKFTKCKLKKLIGIITGHCSIKKKLC